MTWHIHGDVVPSVHSTSHETPHVRSSCALCRQLLTGGAGQDAGRKSWGGGGGGGEDGSSGSSEEEEEAEADDTKVGGRRSRKGGKDMDMEVTFMPGVSGFVYVCVCTAVGMCAYQGVCACVRMRGLAVAVGCAVVLLLLLYCSECGPEDGCHPPRVCPLGVIYEAWCMSRHTLGSAHVCNKKEHRLSGVLPSGKWGEGGGPTVGCLVTRTWMSVLLLQTLISVTGREWGSEWCIFIVLFLSALLSERTGLHPSKYLTMFLG